MLVIIKQFLYISLSFLLLSGCGSLEEDLDKTQEEVEAFWNTSGLGEKAELRSFVWESNIKDWMQRSYSLKNAGREYERAEKDVSHVYKNLLPSLRAGFFFSEPFDDLEDASWSSWSFDLSGYWLFHGLLNLRKDIYRSKLIHYRSGLVLKETLRREMIDLYDAASDVAIIEEKQNLLYATQQLLADDRDLSQFSYQLESDERRFLAEMEAAQLRMNRILSLSNIQWEVSAELPVISSQFSMDSVAGLQRDLWTTDIIASIAKSRSVALEQWPSFRMSATSGSLVSSRNGSLFYDENDRYFYARFTLPLDLTRKRYRDAVEAKEDVTFLKAMLKDTGAQLYEELESLRKQIDLKNEELSVLKKRARTQGAVLLYSSGKERLSHLPDFYRSKIKLFHLEKELNSLLLRVWFFDDSAWIDLEKQLFEVYQDNEA